MNGLRILSKRSVNGRVGHVGLATIGSSLRSLGSRTTTYLLFCLAKLLKSKKIYEFAGDHRNCLLKLKSLLSNLFRISCEFSLLSFSSAKRVFCR